jgi:hypothetical protein
MGEYSDVQARAVFASELMDETQDYLARGQRFEKLSPDQLRDGWVIAVRSLVR